MKYLHITEVDALVITEETTSTDIGEFIMSGTTTRLIDVTSISIGGALVRTATGETTYVRNEDMHEYTALGEPTALKDSAVRAGDIVATLLNEEYVDPDENVHIVFYKGDR